MFPSNIFPASPSFSLAEQRPLSVPVILALVSTALLWPALWPVPPHADTGKNRQNGDCHVQAGWRGRQAGFQNCSSSPVSAAGPLPSQPELVLPRLVSAPPPPSSSSPLWDAAPQLAAVLAPLPSCAPAHPDVAWTWREFEFCCHGGLAASLWVRTNCHLSSSASSSSLRRRSCSSRCLFSRASLLLSARSRDASSGSLVPAGGLLGACGGCEDEGVADPSRGPENK